MDTCVPISEEKTGSQEKTLDIKEELKETNSDFEVFVEANPNKNEQSSPTKDENSKTT